MEEGIVLTTARGYIHRVTYTGPLSEQGIVNVLEVEGPFSEKVFGQFASGAEAVAVYGHPVEGWTFAGEPVDDLELPVGCPMMIAAREGDTLRPLTDQEAAAVRIRHTVSAPLPVLSLDPHST